MRKPEEVIADLKHTLEWSRPNMKFDELSALINEIEAIVMTKPETPKVEEVKVETPKVEEVKVASKTPVRGRTSKK